jgi:uncharacterized protein YkwD
VAAVTVLAVLATLPLSIVRSTPVQAANFDAATAESQLFNDINAARAQNGLPTLVLNPVVGGIARDASVAVCGGQTVHGRSQDMIERNYFSHQITPCGQYVWPVLQAAAVQFGSAAENIGWNNFAPQTTSVEQVNSAFMNSAGHRANILGSYNQVGVGAVMAAAPWSGGGPSAYDGVIMYTEIFVQGPLPQGPPPPDPVGASASPVGATGIDNGLWVHQPTGWTGMGGLLTGAPAVVATNAAAVHLFIATGMDHDLWVRTENTVWRRLSASRVYCLDNPAATLVTNGGSSSLLVACQGSDHALWTSQAPSGSGIPSLTSWSSIGGQFIAGPAVAIVAGVPTFYGVGVDHKVWSATTGGWSPTQWACNGHPAVVADGSSAFFACNGTDSAVWWARNDGAGWSAPRSLGGRFTDGVGAAPASTGVTIYGQGVDGQLSEISVLNGNATTWTNDGGITKFGVGSSQ